jgi:hypothetical protein
LVDFSQYGVAACVGGDIGRDEQQQDNAQGDEKSYDGNEDDSERSEFFVFLVLLFCGFHFLPLFAIKVPHFAG